MIRTLAVMPLAIGCALLVLGLNAVAEGHHALGMAFVGLAGLQCFTSRLLWRAARPRVSQADQGSAQAQAGRGHAGRVHVAIIGPVAASAAIPDSASRPYLFSQSGARLRPCKGEERDSQVPGSRALQRSFASLESVLPGAH